MVFWVLAGLTVVLSLVRLKHLLRHVGAIQAVVVLALRLLAVAVAVLLALPISVSSRQTITQPSRIAVLVDSSRSVDPSVRQQVVNQLKRELHSRTGSVFVWEFADGLKPVDLGELSERAEGSASHLSEAILKVVESVKPDELLVVSDAQDTKPKADAEVLKALQRVKTRLSAMVLPTRLPPNLTLTLSPLQASVFAGEKVNFVAQVKVGGVKKGTSIRLRVWEANKLILQTRLTVAAGVEQTAVTLTPERAGWHRYRFEVSPVEGEVWTADNMVEALVWRAETKLRALLVTGQPNFEFKFVKQAVESEPNFEWVSVASLPDGTRYQQGSPQLIPASLTRPEKFHVVAVIAPTPNEFGAAEGKALWQFVQSGGGLLLTLSEPTVRTNGWRLFIPYPLTLAPLASPGTLVSVKEDLLGSQFPQLPKVDAAWSFSSLPSFAHEALRISGKPVLVWWQEGLGKVALVGIDGTWMWAMEAARRGETPSSHRQFWRTIVRFLADPMKEGKGKGLTKTDDLKLPVPPPAELSEPPKPERLLAWVKASGGQVLSPDELPSWLRSLKWARKATVETKQPISTMPLPYLLLLAALLVEWWLIRRSGLA